MPMLLPLWLMPLFMVPLINPASAHLGHGKRLFPQWNTCESNSSIPSGRIMMMMMMTTTTTTTTVTGYLQLNMSSKSYGGGGKWYSSDTVLSLSAMGGIRRLVQKYKNPQWIWAI
jgi:hypothetical protein